MSEEFNEAQPLAEMEDPSANTSTTVEKKEKKEKKAKKVKKAKVFKDPVKIKVVNGVEYERRFLREDDWVHLPFVAVKMTSVEAAEKFYGPDRLLELLNTKASVLCKKQALSKLPTLEGPDQLKIKEQYLAELGDGDIIGIEHYETFKPGDREWTMASLMAAIKVAKENNDVKMKKLLLVKFTELIGLGLEKDEEPVKEVSNDDDDDDDDNNDDEGQSDEANDESVED